MTKKLRFFPRSILSAFFLLLVLAICGCTESSTEEEQLFEGRLFDDSSAEIVGLEQPLIGATICAIGTCGKTGGTGAFKIWGFVGTEISSTTTFSFIIDGQTYTAEVDTPAGLSRPYHFFFYFTGDAIEYSAIVEQEFEESFE